MSDIKENTSSNMMNQIVNDIKNELILLQKDGRDFYIADRINDNSSFLLSYKDAFYHYVDGIVLCERLYPEVLVQYEEIDMPTLDSETKQILSDFSKYYNEIINNEQIDPNETKEKLQYYQSKLNNINAPTEQVSLPYFMLSYGTQPKILLQKLSMVTDEYIDIISKAFASHVLSFTETMFLSPVTHYNITIKSVANNSFVDIIAIIKK